MAVKGRKPKPTHIKLVEGDEERRINRDEPIPADTEVDLKVPPRGLGTRAAAVWRRLAPDLVDKHVLTAWDVDLFASFCVAKAEYDELRTIRRGHRRDIYQHDHYTSPGSKPGTIVRNPYHRAQAEALDQMLKLATRFGFTPADRAGIVMDVGPGGGGKPQMGAERLLS